MKKSIQFPLIILFMLIQLSGCSIREDKNRDLSPDEVSIYSAIVDSLFDESYDKVFINDSTHSMMRFLKKTSLSEHLFGEEPREYFTNFFKEKQYPVSENLIETFIKNNRNKYLLSQKIMLNRELNYAPHISIYAYSRGYRPKHKGIRKAIKDELKFGVVSFSRICFDDDKEVAMVEVNIHRRNRGETFYSFLKKVNGSWQFLPNCYVYGPYKIKG